MHWRTHIMVEREDALQGAVAMSGFQPHLSSVCGQAGLHWTVLLLPQPLQLNGLLVDEEGCVRAVDARVLKHLQSQPHCNV